MYISTHARSVRYDFKRHLRTNISTIYVVTLEERTRGFSAYLISYRMKTQSPIMPAISGAKTCAEDQGNLTPPHVKAMTTAAVEATTRKLPLNDALADEPGIEANCTHVQSSLKSFSLMVPLGTFRSKQVKTRRPVAPQIGRFMSMPHSNR